MGIIDYKHIFIVDDDPMFAEMLKDYLSNYPAFKISVFHSGEDCIKNLFQKPNVIILDYYLNASSKDAADGIEILTEIKKSDHTIEVIMLSGQEHYGVALQTIAKGAEQYIIKDDKAFDNISNYLKK